MPLISTTQSGIRFGFEKVPSSNNGGTDMIHLRLVVRAGSLLERDDQTGAAHFIEHLGFRGTRKFDHGELVSKIESFGSTFGPDLNARTSLCETIWQLDIPASQLTHGLEVLNEWAFWIRISAADVEAERKVILEEWRQKQTPAQRAKRRFWEVSAPLVSRRLPIGTVNFISGVASEALRAFYESSYVCENICVVCILEESKSSIQKLDFPEFHQAMERTFSLENCPRRVGHHQPTLTFPRSLKDLRFNCETNVEYACVVDPDLQHAAITLEILTGGASRPTPTHEFLRRDMMKRLVSSMLDERFREKRLSSAISQNCSVAFSVGLQHPYVELSSIRTELSSFTPTATDSSDALFTLVHELASCAQLGFAQGELDHAKMKWRRQVSERMMTGGAACEELIEHFSLKEQTPVFGFEQEKQLLLEMLQTTIHGSSISLADINTFTRQWLLALVEPSATTDVLVCLFQGNCVPESFGEAQMRTVVEAGLKAPLRYSDLERYNYSFDEQRLRQIVHESVAEQFEEDVSSVHKRIKHMRPIAHTRCSLPRSDAVIHAFRTAEGAEVRVCVKATKSKQISLQAFALGGASELTDPRDDAALCLACDVVRESGLLALSGSELSRLEAATGTRVFLQRHIHHRGIGGSCPQHELALLLDMVLARITKEQKVNPLVLHRLKHREKQSIESTAARSAASSAGVDEAVVIRELSFGNEEELLKPHKLEHIMDVDERRIRSVLRRGFANSAEFTFCLIGGGLDDSTDLDSLLHRFASSLLASERFDSDENVEPWCREQGKIRKLNVHFRNTGGKIQFIHVGKTITDKSQVFIVLRPHDCELKDIPRKDFWLTAACEAIRSRLIARLRTARGEVYSIGTDFSRAALSPSARVFISFSCAMHNDEELVRSVRKELEEMCRFGFTSQETANVLTNLRSRTERASTDSHMLFRLMDGLKIAQEDYDLADQVASQQYLRAYFDEKMFQTELKQGVTDIVSNGSASLVIRYCPQERL